jgi:hypothetical protein
MKTSTNSNPVESASQSDPGNGDAWKRLWGELHETRYETHYEEFVLEALLERWERASTVSRFVVAITAPTSAISGWALWNTPGFRYIWAAIAGTGAVFAVFDAILHMNDRIKEQTLLLIEFRTLSTDLATFKAQMNIGALSGFNAYVNAFLVLRERLSKAKSKLRGDLWYTKHVQNIAQSRLNALFPR